MKDDTGSEKINKNLEAIKKLLILGLIKNKVTSDDIGKVIGLDASTVRHMVSSGGKKK